MTINRKVYEKQPLSCPGPTDREADRLYPSSFFELSHGDQFRISEYAEALWKLQAGWTPIEAVDSSNAREQYRELSGWNREQHNELVNVLEQPYIDLADRVVTYAINNQYLLEQTCKRVSLIELPYAIAALPPNLFDHKGGEPYIPETDEEIIRLVSEFMLFNRRLNIMGMSTAKDFNHSYMGTVISRGFDVVLELQRRRDSRDQTFTSEGGRQAWKNYNQQYKRRLLEDRLGELSRNATYIAYRNNRRFSEIGGFLELADDKFESFWLTDFNSKSAFTSQIRVPIGWYGPQAAKELTLGTHMMMELIDKDSHFAQDIKRVAHDPKTRLLCQQHLLRSRDGSTVTIDPVEHGIKQTALEGILSVSATYAGMIEADGIPGYETDLWTGLSATLDQRIATQITADMPSGVVAAMTIWGDRFKEPLTTNGTRIRERPAVSAKLQQIHERRTALQHAMWQAHNQSGATGAPPVRFGLHCPFKGEVVGKMAETLMVCRAIAHESPFT